MIAVDTNVLSLFLYPNASVPDDYRTKAPIPHGRERVRAFINELEEKGEIVVVPTPALAEALVVAAPEIKEYLEILNSSRCFTIEPFGQRAAIEVALHLKSAKVAGDKRDHLSADECVWDKVNFDRQIVAIAKAIGATICSTDRHIHHHADIWNVPHKHIADLPDPLSAVKQTELFDEKEEVAESGPHQVSGGGDGPSEDQAGAEVHPTVAGSDRSGEKEPQRAEDGAE